MLIYYLNLLCNSDSVTDHDYELSVVSTQKYSNEIYSLTSWVNSNWFKFKLGLHLALAGTIIILFCLMYFWLTDWSIVTDQSIDGGVVFMYYLS